MSADGRYVHRGSSKSRGADGPLSGLREALDNARRRGQDPPERPGRCPAVIPADDSPDTSDQSDEEAFRAAMEGVKEIRKFRQLKVGVTGKRFPVGPPRENSRELLETLVAGREPLDLTLTDEYVEWRRKDQPRDIVRRLHRGEYSVQDTLDLHGLTRDAAIATLAGFLADVRNQGLACVKIIHGRGLRSPGEPVLRIAVREWLVRGPYRKRIRAFSTARGQDGGLGAIYVLLQR